MSDSYYDRGFLLRHHPHYPDCLPHEWKSRLLRPPRARPADEHPTEDALYFLSGFLLHFAPQQEWWLGGGGLLNSLAGLSHHPPSRVFHTFPFHGQLAREAAVLRRLAGPSGPVPALTCWVPFSEEHRGAVAPHLRREGCAGES